MKSIPQKNGAAERFLSAKALMTAAAEAAINGSPDAVQLATDALAELERATTAGEPKGDEAMTDKPKPPAARARLCAHPECGVFVLSETRCWKHRTPDPAAEWQVAQDVRDEQAR